MNQVCERIACIALIGCCLSVGACGGPVGWEGSVEALLRSQPARFANVIEDPEKFRVQVIYTQIDRDPDNRPKFTSFTYRVDANEYFYPASTVKLPTVLLALEKLNRIEGIDRNTTMLTGRSADFQVEANEDVTAPGGLPTVGHYVRKILLVSDNDAFNRLYEFLGQQPLNEALQEKGYGGTRIMHRLETALTIEENRLTNPVRFVRGDDVIYEQLPQYSSKAFVNDSPILLGKAEVVGDQLLPRPKDFAEKNAFPLQDLHDVLLTLMFPDEVAPARRFGLSEDDYRFLYDNMSTYPADSGIGAYANADEYPPGYVKFLLFGGDARQIPQNLRIFNKVGDAYGFLTDAAYVVDLENKVEFILAATIYTNENQTFNDNNYEYAGIGLPFLRDLGQAIYEVELDRPRTIEPDLSRFRDLE